MAILGEDIGKSETELKLVKAYEDRPVELKPSTTDGDYTTDPKHYVTWIRIGNELMKIVDFIPTSDGGGIVRVKRNFDGKCLEEHHKGDPVLCPMYLQGYYPGSGNKVVYFFDPASIVKWKIALDVLIEFAKEGGDGIWMDLLGCSPFKPCDIMGKPLRPFERNGTFMCHAWNFEKGREYTFDEFREKTEIGLRFIQEEFYKRFGKYPIIFGNQIHLRTFEVGQGGQKCYLVSTKIKPGPIDGMCIENFAGRYVAEEWQAWLEYGKVIPPNKWDYEKWSEKVQTLMRCVQENLTVLPKIINADCKSQIYECLDREIRHEFELWAYASYLLAVEKNGRCPAILGINPIYTDRSGRKYIDLDQVYFWRIGEPVETKNNLEEYRVRGHFTYMRRFTNGIVLVNPFDKEDVIELNDSYYDPDLGIYVSSVKMKPKSGKILLKTPPTNIKKTNTESINIRQIPSIALL